MTLQDVIVRHVSRSATTTSGDRIEMPAEADEVVVSTYTIPRRAALPVHKHPNPRFGYVLSGALRVVNEETGHVAIFKAGDFIVEDVGRWHKARNIGAGPVKLLVIDFVRPGDSNTVLRDTR